MRNDLQHEKIQNKNNSKGKANKEGYKQIRILRILKGYNNYAWNRGTTKSPKEIAEALQAQASDGGKRK